MIHYLKEKLHFPIASCFLFFAKIKLKRWNPKIVVITGSSGKTTLLHMVESELGNKAIYSHKANSPFGIAFNILGLKRKTLKPIEWLFLIIKTPFAIFSKIPHQKIYVVEADCDRPKEGEIMSRFLNPDIILWLSVSKTHAMNFDKLVPSKFSNVLDAIAYEYGFYIERARELVLVNGDSAEILRQLSRTKVLTKKVTVENNLKSYEPGISTTRFVLAEGEVILPALLPEEVFYSVELTRLLVEHLGLNFDSRFENLELSPGRSSAFKGIKNTTLVDSTYNSNLGSAKAALNMFKEMPGDQKWVVMGDMLELGESSKGEHEKLAEEIKNYGFQKAYLFGPLASKYTYTKLSELGVWAKAFTSHQELLTAINKDILGGESILFKGSQSCQLDAPLEMLLLNKSDSDLLPRREKAWQDRRDAMKLHL